MSKATLTLNGMTVEFQPGQTILEVARGHGVYTIPTLCYLKDTTATGSCRMCMVEVEGARTLLPACATVANPGMVIKTESPRVDASRKMVLELILGSGNHNCLICEANGECELQSPGLSLPGAHPQLCQSPGHPVLLRRRQHHDRPGLLQVHHVRPLRPGLQ